MTGVYNHKEIFCYQQISLSIIFACEKQFLSQWKFLDYDRNFGELNIFKN